MLISNEKSWICTKITENELEITLLLKGENGEKKADEIALYVEKVKWSWLLILIIMQAHCAADIFFVQKVFQDT